MRNAKNPLQAEVLARGSERGHPCSRCPHQGCLVAAAAAWGNVTAAAWGGDAVVVLATELAEESLDP